mmetsp:Transcript_34614/g.62335  ORF Transcript_34614/g.62335 Transcript_34614/m.62335 type:complete len:218 (-) Transcript_34614:123-776(-)
MMFIFAFLSISMVVSGSGSATAFTIPSSGCNHFFAPKAFPSSTRHSTSTSIFFRDTDSFDEIGGSPKKNVEKPSDFQSRMKSIVVQQKSSTSPKSKNKVYRPKNVKTAVSLKEFADVIEEARREDKVVVVRFIATWCKKCHTLRPSFDKAATSHPQVIFVDVPVLESNSNLHKGLGVESVPFGHIYHPKKGLVEETKLSRKTFSEFEGLVKMYCNLT